jgi:hypothetical protein
MAERCDTDIQAYTYRQHGDLACPLSFLMEGKAAQRGVSLHFLLINEVNL